MDVITYEYTKQRKDYGHHHLLDDSAICITSIPSQVSDSDGSTKKASSGGSNSGVDSQWLTPVSTTLEVECIQSRSIHEVNTERYITHSKGKHTLSHRRCKLVCVFVCFAI